MWETTEGVAGAVSEIVTVTTSADPGQTVGGQFKLSFDYQGLMTQATAGTGTVAKGSRTVATTHDLRPFFRRGDRVHDQSPLNGRVAAGCGEEAEERAERV